MSTIMLRIYDLSQGMARSMSGAILGKQIDGIWHTGIVAFDREYYFGGGICSDPPGMSPYGTPYSVETLGTTQKTKEEFMTFLSSISSQFSFGTYHVLDNNCNNFSDACAVFLVGNHIPQYILDLPNEAMNSPLGPVIRPMIEQMQSSIRDQSLGHEVQLPSSQTATPDAAPSTASRSVASASSPTASTLRSTAPSVSQPYWATAITLEKGNREAISSKLREFAPDFSESITIPDLAALSQSLPPSKAFPALDLLRLRAAQDELSAKAVVSELKALLEHFALAADVPRPAQMMALRAAVNSFKFAKSSGMLFEPRILPVIVDAIAESLPHAYALIRKTAALLALNVCGAPQRHPKTVPVLLEEHKVRLAFSLVNRLNADDDRPSPDEARPLLSALIVLADGDPDSLMLVKTFGLDLDAYRNASSCDDVHTRSAAIALSKLLASV